MSITNDACDPERPQPCMFNVKSGIFIPTHIKKKKVPSQFKEWPSQDLCTRSDYESSYNRSCHKSVSHNIRRLLLSLSKNLIMQETLTSIIVTLCHLSLNLFGLGFR